MTTIDLNDDLLRKTCTVFDGFAKVSSGAAFDVVPEVKSYVDTHENASILIFDDTTGDVIDVDFRGPAEDVINAFRRRSQLSGPTANLIASLNGGDTRVPVPGRPRLGVVAREVTLLPRHWDWLGRQPGGASVALRKLVEEARRDSRGRDKVRASQESAYRFLSAIAGDLPGFEEALRALFAGNRERYENQMSTWPSDIREFAVSLAADALSQ